MSYVNYIIDKKSNDQLLHCSPKDAEIESCLDNNSDQKENESICSTENDASYSDARDNTRIFKPNRAAIVIIRNRKQLFSHLNQRKILQRHQKVTHSSRRIFSCACQYKTNEKEYLVKRMLIHTGELLFACDLCDYKTRQRSNLKNHMSNHSGKYAY